jgi:hypothetical protein
LVPEVSVMRGRNYSLRSSFSVLATPPRFCMDGRRLGS